MTPKRVIEEILARPYGRLVIPDSDGTFSAEIVEFSGCIATGDTAAQALESLEEVAADWIDAALAQGQDIPEPLDSAGYSGKLVLRMPKSLHQKAALYAGRDGVSLNQFIVTCLAEHVGVRAQMKVFAAQSMQTLYAPMLVVQLPHSYPSLAPQFVASGSNMLVMTPPTTQHFAREAARA